MGKGCALASRHRYLAVLGTVSAVVAAGAVIAPVVVAGAEPPVTTLVVNSTAWGGADANPGDGKCETATGNGLCTLRAAIMESNALNGAPGEIEITVDPSSIPPNTKMTLVSGISGTELNVTADKMITSSLTAQDAHGAYFEVTAPVKIDLGHRLQVDGSGNDKHEGAAFYLNGPDIQVLNADQVLSPGSSFVAGPHANRVLIDGDTAGGFAHIATPNWNPERFVTFREGASNVTVRNYHVTGYLDNTMDAGVFVFDAYSPYTPISNITIDRIQVFYSSTGGCNDSDGTGCRPRLTNFWNGSSTWWTSNNIIINGLTFTNMVVRNMSGEYALYLGSTASNSPAISNLRIENNLFLNNRSSGTAFLTLPYGSKLTGTNSISDNVFTRASSDSYAIYYSGAATANSTAPSGLTIANNYFDGYTGGATIQARSAGLVTVTGNTFGPNTGSQSATLGIAEEYNDPSNIMFNNYHSAPRNSTNQTIRTWAPMGTASVLAGPIPSDAFVMDDPRDGGLLTCPAQVQAAKISGSNPGSNNLADNYSQTPGEPVTLQAYWTGSRTAEVYLGQVEHVTGTSATVVFELPVGAVTLPDGTTATVVDSDTGAVSGNVRLQTHVESLGQLESSQYSRMVAVTGNCRPAVTIEQASGMADPTYGRDLHFTVTSTVPLDPGTVTTDDIEFTAAPVAETIDPARLNPRVVSVEPVPGSDGRQFDVIIHVDDSAAVSVALGAGKVATAAGLTNPAAATSADNAITFLNPLQVNPSSFTLVTGEPHGKTFTISVAAGAPVPAADVVFSATVDQPEGTPEVSLSTSSPALQAGQTSTEPVIVTAGEGDVTANTEVTITMTVESLDANYDGLVVRAVTPRLFSTDPAIRVVKRAYTDVGDASSAAQIEETGTLAPSGMRLMDRQAVCFVYTVSNVSRDDWTTNLSDIEVTDSDSRLGINGLIGTVSLLADGDSAKLSWCTSLVPVDTTVGG